MRFVSGVSKGCGGRAVAALAFVVLFGACKVETVSLPDRPGIPVLTTCNAGQFIQWSGSEWTCAGTDLSSLASSLNDLAGRVAALESAGVRPTADGGGGGATDGGASAITTRLAVLEAAVGRLEGSIDGGLTRVASLEARTTTTEANVAGNGARLSVLESRAVPGQLLNAYVGGHGTGSITISCGQYGCPGRVYHPYDGWRGLPQAAAIALGGATWGLMPPPASGAAAFSYRLPLRLYAVADNSGGVAKWGVSPAGIPSGRIALSQTSSNPASMNDPQGLLVSAPLVASTQVYVVEVGFARATLNYPGDGSGSWTIDGDQDAIVLGRSADGSFNAGITYTQGNSTYAVDSTWFQLGDVVWNNRSGSWQTNSSFPRGLSQ